MPCVKDSWEVCEVSASIICSSSMRSNSTACRARLCTTSTKHDRIKGSSSRDQSYKLSQCHQISKAARSPPSQSWVGSIMTIDEVHKFFPQTEEMTARVLRNRPPSVHHQAVAGHFRHSMEQASQMDTFWHRSFWLQEQGYSP